MTFLATFFLACLWVFLDMCERAGGMEDGIDG
jgi:hypothetical protein